MLVIILWVDIRLHVHDFDRCIFFRAIQAGERERTRDESQQQKKRNVSMHALNCILSVYASCSSFCCFGCDFVCVCVCALLLQWSSLLPTMEFLFTVSFESKWIFVSFSFLFFSGSQRYLFRYFVGYNKEEFRKNCWKKIRLKSRTEKEPTLIWRTKKSAWKFPSNIFFCFQVEIKREIEFFFSIYSAECLSFIEYVEKKGFIQIQKL